MERIPLYVTEHAVREILTWPLAIETTKEALSAVSNCNPLVDNFPSANQPARNFTWTSKKSGVLLTMPGFVGDYTAGDHKSDSLGCKLVTAFPTNSKLPKQLPTILANIFLLDNETGQLKCIMEATELTAWRTAAASVNATKYLYYNRNQSEMKSTKNTVLAILGCGVQGRYHAMAICSTFNISEVRLWNRTKSKAEQLKIDLEKSWNNFKNRDVKISAFDSSDECASESHIIVTATFADLPILSHLVLKEDVHINAIGAGITHYSELDEHIYLKGQLYVDSISAAENELKGLNARIIGELGEVINGKLLLPQKGITIFQSMGMAAEDIILAEEIFKRLNKDNLHSMKVI